MKTDTKAWTSNHGEAYSPSKEQQTLCESISQSLASQSRPGFADSAFRLVNRQGTIYYRRKEQPRTPLYCAKTGCYLVPLGRSGLFAKVDPESVPKIVHHHWHVHKYGLSSTSRSGGVYAATRKGGFFVPMHRLLLGLGPSATDMRVADHINGNGLDNRMCNLRVATMAENARNRRAKKSRPFKGIRRMISKKKPWAAVIGPERKHIGSFATPEEAARAYDAAALKRYGQFAYLNFPESTAPSNQQAAKARELGISPKGLQ